MDPNEIVTGDVRTIPLQNPRTVAEVRPDGVSLTYASGHTFPYESLRVAQYLDIVSRPMWGDQ